MKRHLISMLPRSVAASRTRVRLCAAIVVCAAALLPQAALADPVAGFRRLLAAGDGAGALAVLERGREDGGPAAGALRSCVAERLDPRAAYPVPAALSGKGAAARILEAYRRYWMMALSDLGAHDRARDLLLARLWAALPRDVPGWDRSSISEATEAARRYLEGHGLYAIGGMAGPFHELVVWAEQSPQAYDVELDGRKVPVPVVFLDGFVSSGWLGYASCERFAAAGWTEGGRAFAVRGRYDLAGEDFRVGLLAHEARHVADRQAFPGMAQPEREYRAMLTELALSRDSTRERLRRFRSAAMRGRAAPGAHAAYWVARDLRDALFAAGAGADWELVDDAALRATARRLLERSTERLGAPAPGGGFSLPD